VVGLKYALKNFDGTLLAKVEQNNGKIFLEAEQSNEEDEEYNADFFYCLFSQPYVTQSGGSEKTKEGIVRYTEQVELQPDDKNFFKTIIADGPKLGFIAEEVK